MWFLNVIGLCIKPADVPIFLSIKLSWAFMDSKRILIVRPTWYGSWTGMDRQKCYKLNRSRCGLGRRFAWIQWTVQWMGAQIARGKRHVWQGYVPTPCGQQTPVFAPAGRNQYHAAGASHSRNAFCRHHYCGLVSSTANRPWQLSSCTCNVTC